jgi:MFS superfamily sulfate permease-like transporter
MAIVSGAVCIVVGMLRLGFVTELLSKPIRYGYMNGIAFTGADQSASQALRILDRECRAAA